MAGAKDKGNQRFLTHERILGRLEEQRENWEGFLLSSVCFNLKRGNSIKIVLVVNLA